MTIASPLDGPLHPLLWPRLPGDAEVPAMPRTVEEALGLMERSHAASNALLSDEDPVDGETVPLSQAWFAAVREACARTGPVPGVERYLLEWWITEPPAEGLARLPWLFGVWQGHWVCWAGTTPWAAADLTVTTPWDRDAFEQAVRFGSDPEHPPAEPWTTLGTSALAVPTVILLALAGKPATGAVRMPVTPTPAPVAAPPPPPPAPAPAPIPPPPGAPGAEPTTADLVAEDPATAEPGVATAASTLSSSSEPEPELEPGTVEPDPELDPETAEPETVEPEAEPDPELDPETQAETVEAEADTVAPETEAVAPETEPETVGPEPATPEPQPEPAAVAPVEPIEPVPTPPATALPPGDWYPDPSGRHEVRYWDGTRWTEHAADRATGQVIDPI